jgi:hypothetical protein
VSQGRTFSGTVAPWANQISGGPPEMTEPAAKFSGEMSIVVASVIAICTGLAGGRPLVRQRRGQRGGGDNLTLIQLIDS